MQVSYFELVFKKSSLLYRKIY